MPKIFIISSENGIVSIGRSGGGASLYPKNFLILENLAESYVVPWRVGAPTENPWSASGEYSSDVRNNI